MYFLYVFLCAGFVISKKSHVMLNVTKYFNAKNDIRKKTSSYSNVTLLEMLKTSHRHLVEFE